MRQPISTGIPLATDHPIIKGNSLATKFAISIELSLATVPPIFTFQSLARL